MTFDMSHWLSLLPVIIHFANGGTIQYRASLAHDFVDIDQDFKDQDGDDFSFNNNPDYYRIKPKYRPYDRLGSSEYVDGYNDQHPKFAMARLKVNPGSQVVSFKMIVSVGRIFYEGGNRIYSCDEMFDRWVRVLEDGATTPFGVLE